MTIKIDVDVEQVLRFNSRNRGNIANFNSFNPRGLILLGLSPSRKTRPGQLLSVTVVVTE